MAEQPPRPTGAGSPRERQEAEAALKEVLTRTSEAFGVLEELAATLPEALTAPLPGQLEQLVKADPAQAEAIALAFVEAFKAIGAAKAGQQAGRGG